MKPGFRKRLHDGEALYGTLLSLPSAAVAEVLATASFDWLFVDTEHGAIGTATMLSILQAVDRDLACIVRLPQLDGGAIKRVLDAGAQGIMIPQVETADQAREIVRLSRYAPDGERGMGPGRAHGYGAYFSEYVARANDEVTVVIQVEHARAVDNIEAIAAVAGIDCVFVGPYDLSQSLGHAGDVAHPSVITAIDHVTRTCQAAGMPLGYYGIDAAAVAPYVARGYTLICAASDSLLLGRSAAELRETLRNHNGGSVQ
jgi:2-dehydro-3-deoxyglucarate aldolase